MGCHSVIDKPEWVNRVMPPTTTMAKTSEQHSNSHAAMLLRSSGVEAWAPAGADIEGVISIASNFAIGAIGPVRASAGDPWAYWVGVAVTAPVIDSTATSIRIDPARWN